MDGMDGMDGMEKNDEMHMRDGMVGNGMGWDG